MITIITAHGVSLDLEPTGSFEIEMEQPLLDSEGVPVPYSTEISFLPTRKNCDEFGYVDAMMLEPSVKQIAAEIYIDAYKLMSGILIYSSIEDGKINYTFSAKGTIDRLEDKDISESSLPGLELNLIDVIQILSGKHRFVKNPLLINKSAALYGLVESPDLPDFQVDIYTRYHNYPYRYGPMTPAVRLYDFIVNEFPSGRLAVHESILEDMKKIYMICPYKQEVRPVETAEDLLNMIDLKGAMPKISLLDVFKNMARIFGAAYFKDGERLILLPSKAILEATAVKDWSGKVSDIFSSHPEEPQSYMLKFEDDSDDNTYDVKNLSEDVKNGEIMCGDTYWSAIQNNYPPIGDFRPIKHNPTGDIFSVTTTAVITPQEKIVKLFPADSLLRSAKSVDPVDSKSTFDNSISFSLVRPVPDICVDVSSGKYDWYFTVAPILKAPAIGEERGNKAIIGIIEENQMTDKGYVAVRTQDSIDKGEKAYTDKYAGFSLAPQDLMATYHKDLASWLAKRRQVVSVMLNLDIAEIASFRMYDKIYFKGRYWLPLKFSITADVETGTVQASGDFISL